MSTVLQKSNALVAEAFGMIERAEPGDCLSVGVALDYAQDALGVERSEVKIALYRYVAQRLTVSAADTHNHNHSGAATYLSIELYDGSVQNAKQFMQGYGSNDEWKKAAKRLVKLCSWIESVP